MWPCLSILSGAAVRLFGELLVAAIRFYDDCNYNATAAGDSLIKMGYQSQNQARAKENAKTLCETFGSGQKPAPI